MKATHIANPVRVRAWQIDRLEKGEFGTAALDAENHGTCLTPEQTVRYEPVPGDYVVTQEDGYVYVNPKDVFERKYSLITE